MLNPEAFFNLADFVHSSVLFQGANYVWDALNPDRLQALLRSFLASNTGIYGKVMSGVIIEDESIIYIGEGTIVESGVYIKGPAIIGRNCEIRHGAYIRENVVTGDDCVIGHATEVKHSIFLNRSKAPHFSYVGDSILGNDVNLGAGTKLSNLPVTSGAKVEKRFRPSIKIKLPDGNVVDTNLSKLGAILGDGTETGCNVVTNPGCLLGKNTLVYPNASLRGYYPAQTIIKWKPELELAARGETKPEQ
jgi:UDP-N-acetylglucosamine diphosphorylase / glucose-1-phosphate thymidylyltransferase / UDP-N-acetylgalactosamine diphosphorylase / glucosamine-1-phosphate N-acetyltransferase / galactosamine-1-phosphate N-acetyltransferase